MPNFVLASLLPDLLQVASPLLSRWRDNLGRFGTQRRK